MILQPSDIFNTAIPFNEKAIRAFHYQMKHNAVYNSYVNALNVDYATVDEIEKIPFIPVELFKSHKLIAAPDFEAIFFSSGTTGDLSKHYVHDTSLYIKSFTECFRTFYGNEADYCFLALLPSYLERQNSSLVFMCDKFIRSSNHPLSGFYLNNIDELSIHLNELRNQQQPVMLIGVSYALLDLAEKHPVDFPELIIVETGGMKGRRNEMIREELHSILKNAFEASAVHSEYGMTELLSQAWSKGEGIYQSPHWMKILIRDINDPFRFPGHGYTGGINVIDLANIYSCPFIATQDLGRSLDDVSFEVLGRFDNSDLRGCNLLVNG